MKLHYYPETDSLYIELKSTPGTETSSAFICRWPIAGNCLITPNQPARGRSQRAKALPSACWTIPKPGGD